MIWRDQTWPTIDVSRFTFELVSLPNSTWVIGVVGVGALEDDLRSFLGNTIMTK